MMSTGATFLLAFPALFSIVNPFGTAFLFEQLVGSLPRPERARVAGRVALYALGVMLGALWFGADILGFFGVTLAALRLGGGLILVVNGFELLLTPERKEARKQEQADAGHRPATDMAFFPLTMPLTTGPGTISVAIALGTARPEAWTARATFFFGASAAAAATALIVWVTYWSADWLAAHIPPAMQRVIARLSAFLLLCIGVQIMIAGVDDVAVLVHSHLVETTHQGVTP